MCIPGRNRTLKNVHKISISLSAEVLDWVYKNKGDMKVSTFINKALKDRMTGGSGLSCNVCEELRIIENRLKRLEEDIHDLRMIKTKKAGTLSAKEHISILSARPKEVFGELVNIKNVSANNAMAVYQELLPFIQKKKVIDREVVLKELFPNTGSSITNNINYWYNACRGVLDHLIERGDVIKVDKNKYKWIGKRP
ncbi:hypothetical protein CUJ83_03120 [Methanocella sp. CWC-04]|uniref:Uncharacterized protein n=1 Tax=Methanooceanicella nereidis TaxID=2052831 RepID=A0AAP2RAI5_9EURY|nr:hypothetical protein [Methanocella sp. CWC-04]MCD1293986.1 hypothetical protein [Methanocella sp. CWC-04]